MQKIVDCRLKLKRAGVGMFLTAALALPALGATVCVNPGGTSGCVASISAAVAAAAPGAIIQVGPGIYKESVQITQTLSLIGTPGTTVIDAKGLSTGIFINGMAAAPNAGIGGVIISGFTIKNANFEGIVVANVTGAIITGNKLYNNNLGLVVSSTGATCPGTPAFETNEGFDCGEAIHLTGADHSVISNNDIENNAGGILISDETGPTHDNVITGNTVADNALDCGITIASHTPAPNLPQGPSYGVIHNTISHNLVTHNGYLAKGAGVGIFAPGPGAIAVGNVVSDNILRDNGIGGVSMHNHAAPGVNGVPAQAPPVYLSDNVIVGNSISGNENDDCDSMSPGPTGISILSLVAVTGTVIAQNDFAFESADIVFDAPGGTVEAHLNNFNSTGAGVDAEGAGTINASMNWWGCPGGPGALGCATTIGSSLYISGSLPGPITLPPPVGQF